MSKQEVIQLINQWLERSGLSKKSVYTGADLSESVFYNGYLNPTREVSRDLGAALAIVEVFMSRPRQEQRCTAEEVVRFFVLAKLPIEAYAGAHERGWFSEEAWQAALTRYAITLPQLPPEQDQPDEVLTTLRRIEAAIDTLPQQPSGKHSSASLPGEPQAGLTLPAQGQLRSRRELVNRERMLAKIGRFWIDGVLARSLYGAAMFDLGLHYEPGAVVYPWEMVVEHPSRMPTPVPPGTSLQAIFDDAVGRLLILGEPGSGKTTLLLTLARSLLEAAREDNEQPIPVILSLSSWALRRTSIERWLSSELEIKYDVPRRVARDWLRNEELMLLLDGLDEVPQRHRVACVQEINTFSVERSMPIVVCSRRAEYADLLQKLRLQQAVVIQPLTPDSVEDYLSGAGPRLSGLRAALAHEPILRDMAASPLMLNVMTLAYQGKSVAEVPLMASEREQRTALFESYLTRMLSSKGLHSPYNKQREAVLGWLAWLAGQLQRNEASEFVIEEFQPGWLPSPGFVWAYIIGSRMVSAFMIGLSLGIGLYAAGPAELLAVGLLGGAVVSCIDGVRLWNTRGGGQVKRAPALVSILGVWLVITLVLGGYFGLVKDAPESDKIFGLFAVTGLNLGSFIGVFFGVLFGLRGRRQSFHQDVQPVEVLSWSSREALNGAVSYALGFAVMLSLMACSVWLSGGRGYIWLEKVMDDLWFWPVAQPAWQYQLLRTGALGVVAGLIFGSIFGGMIEGLKRGIVRKPKIELNQGVRLSLRNALITIAIFGTIYTLFFSLLLHLTTSLGSQAPLTLLLSSVFNGLSFGLLAALWNGGFDVIQHYVLRLLLYATGRIPSFAYADFLDYASECILLQRAGGMYRFYHRALMEHIATQAPAHSYKPQWPRVARRALPLLVGLLGLYLCWAIVEEPLAYALHSPAAPTTSRVHHLKVGDNINSPVGLDSGIVLKEGDQVTLQANWRMHTGHFVTWVDPNGTPVGFLGFPMNNTWDIPDIPEGTHHGALMCRVDGEPAWHRCGSYRRFTAPESGTLLFHINGIEYQKYLGHYYVSVYVEEGGL